MQLEFHQLDRRLETLRVRHPARQRRLLASLAESGQQTPIIVIPQQDRYLVIDGHKRVAALEQLNRDTVEALVWEMSEAEALLLERSMRTSQPETAIEQGWLLQEMESRLSYSIEKLARHFDRSKTWVASRLALVETLPQAVQQLVREGKIAAATALRYLAPVARVNAEHCQRLAEAFANAAQQWTTRQAGELYRAWRNASRTMRERIVAAPDLYRKAQQPNSSLEKRLNQIAAIAQQALADLESPPLENSKARRKIEHAIELLNQLQQRIEEPEHHHVDPNPTRGDSPTAFPTSQQVPKREIARLLEISRQSVRQVLKANSASVPKIERSEKPARYRQQILELLPHCKGNLVRVHEELVAGGAEFSYQALTAFCRREEIGHTPPAPAGRYQFEPGEETQHDTSPHTVTVGGRAFKAQTASAVLCYSRMLFFQILPGFQRFDCKVFLTAAMRYFQGATKRVMIDNTHVVVLRGTGRAMEPVPEMAAFAERLGFGFVAHEIGDANRSGRVERPFHFIENNFLAGRTFTDWADLNHQARAWCDRVNATYKKHIRAIPTELYAVERPLLKPLPAWLPEVYRLHHRIVDVEGYVSLNSNRYSVPASFIGRQVEVRETFDHVEIQLDARRLVTHRRILTPDQVRVTLPEHRPPRGQGPRRNHHPERAEILAAVPGIEPYVDNLERRGRKVIALVLRHLLRLLREYPREAFLGAIEEAGRYGLYDLDRVERMILRRVRSEYFRLEEHND